MAFTAQDVKKLREMTNVGMMDCKAALAATDGDMDKAVDWLREKGPGMYSAGYSEPAAQGFSRLFSAFSEESELTDVKAAAALQDILISLSDSYKSKDKTAALSRSVSHIKAFYTTQISVGELAALEGLSVSRYNTLFKKYTGTSPIKYITSLRIKHAATLLSSTNLDVKTVGELVGYEDNHFFSKTFKTHIGISPSEYRKQREK